ncbi:hypothetical protein K431DRAFT_322880 [Polychaeton citri CBS 116435]|uniref:Helicase C-terminal domain-containing protein n=1 Tax=Polychaeton citri CBS 116435 TaxID=1314669 RepID=A0A9P4Q1I9_9PEZI|nr:hypothetical protein K431DRAFT_322880 [Polychaeton citri CBS 116435]
MEMHGTGKAEDSAASDSSTTSATTPATSNLDNFIAAGCILQSSHDFTRASSDDEWHDGNSVTHIIRDKHLAGALSILVSAGWVRLKHKLVQHTVIVRIYVLPFDSGNRFIERQSKKLQQALSDVLLHVRTDADLWYGDLPNTAPKNFDRWSTPQDGSLFYCFNRIESPAPSPTIVKGKYAREALEDLLEPKALPGLKTLLYPYQRRSAGAMLQREASPSLGPDPRVEPRISPDDTVYFFNAWDVSFTKTPLLLENSRSGILAESMGLGKTVIVLALILATKDLMPRIPPHLETIPIRTSVGSLADMAAAKVTRASVPWKIEFDRIRHAFGEDMRSCVQRIERHPPTYDIPSEPARWNRRTKLPAPRSMYITATTLIVVPRNLQTQWTSEIAKHVEKDALNVLVVDHDKDVPPPEALRRFDVILFSRNRFEREIRDGFDKQGRNPANINMTCSCPYIGSTRQRDCTCATIDDQYDSPLKHLHFKRLIIDEGHFSSNKRSNAVVVANRLVTADHRWVVSGTPAKDLLGVEVDVSSAESSGLSGTLDTLLTQRRQFTSDDITGPIKAIGSFATFLRMEPWAGADGNPAVWEDYVYRHEAFRRKTFSAFAGCLQQILNNMMIKTRPEDVDRDIELPPLVHKVIRLPPSFHDKLTANLFTMVLTINAVTSERTDADYLFHKNSAKARYQLITNLRQSAFFWTGFSEADVLSSIRITKGYLEKASKGEAKCSAEDKKSLEDVLQFATDTLLKCDSWIAMSRFHEIGLCVEDWPIEATTWSFSDSGSRTISTGLTQVHDAQKHVYDRIWTNRNPVEGLASAGVRALSILEDPLKAPEDNLIKSGIPTSSLTGEPLLKKRKKRSQAKAQRRPRQKQSESLKRKCQDVVTEAKALPTRVVGTASSKLSYLLSQIAEHAPLEKIIVFYTGENAAWYIAQALDIIDVKHEIYARGLKAGMKSEYVVRFNESDELRVLLMDISQAAFGLNICSASRIYFLNPVCRPMVEAQAVKRAHRIGQTRRVHVETLVLQDSLEEKMMERAKRMTRTEHREARALEDDGGIREIIQGAKLLSVSDAEKNDPLASVAPLERPQYVWKKAMGDVDRYEKEGADGPAFDSPRWRASIAPKMLEA